MAQEVTNFARFYASFNKLAYRGDREEFKRALYYSTRASARTVCEK